VLGPAAEVPESKLAALAAEVGPASMS